MHEGTARGIVDQLYQEHQALVGHLIATGEISLQVNVDSNFRKTLLLAAASYFETALSESLIALFSDRTHSAEPMVEFVRNKAIARQYHTFFNWDRSNANSFFGLFGSTFSQYMSGEVNNDAALDSSIRAFLELGNIRNQLVHQNFASFPLEKTVDEIYTLYRDALRFVEAFPSKIGDYLDGLASDG